MKKKLETPGQYRLYDDNLDVSKEQAPMKINVHSVLLVR